MPGEDHERDTCASLRTGTMAEHLAVRNTTIEPATDSFRPDVDLYVSLLMLMWSVNFISAFVKHNIEITFYITEHI